MYAGESVADLPDRVIVKIVGKRAKYCGLVTHIVSHSYIILFKILEETNRIDQQGQPGNGFARCG